MVNWTRIRNLGSDHRCLGLVKKSNAYKASIRRLLNFVREFSLVLKNLYREEMGRIVKSQIVSPPPRGGFRISDSVSGDKDKLIKLQNEKCKSSRRERHISKKSTQLNLKLPIWVNTMVIAYSLPFFIPLWYMLWNRNNCFHNFI